MADFGFLSDTDDSAVEELISQTRDLCALEQVSKINCAGFTDSVLPTDLQTRFHKLKSFPVSKSQAPSINKSLSKSNSADMNNNSERGRTDDSWSLSDCEKGENFSNKKEDPDGKVGSLKCEKEVLWDNKESPERRLGSEKVLKSECVSSPSNSSMEEEIFSLKKDKPPGEKKGFKKKALHVVNSPDCREENVIFSPSKQKPEKKTSSQTESKSKSKSGSFASPLGSPSSLMDSPSPPKRGGCFWCSPKSLSKRKGKQNSSLDWGNNEVDDLLSDLSTFSVKEQQKRLKMAMKEQEKMSKEAEKIVKWAKQESARMSLHGIDDELSDDDIAK